MAKSYVGDESNLGLPPFPGHACIYFKQRGIRDTTLSASDSEDFRSLTMRIVVRCLPQEQAGDHTSQYAFRYRSISNPQPRAERNATCGNRCDHATIPGSKMWRAQHIVDLGTPVNLRHRTSVSALRTRPFRLPFLCVMDETPCSSMSISVRRSRVGAPGTW